MGVKEKVELTKGSAWMYMGGNKKDEDMGVHELEGGGVKDIYIPDIYGNLN